MERDVAPDLDQAATNLEKWPYPPLKVYLSGEDYEAYQEAKAEGSESPPGKQLVDEPASYITNSYKRKPKK